MAERVFRRLSFEKGLLESQEASAVPEGFATELLNWVPEPGGGLRVRRPWLKGSVTGSGSPATRRCRGIGTFARPRIPFRAQEITGGNTGTGTGSSLSVVLTWPTTTVAGSLLVLRVAVRHAGTNITSITSSGWTSEVFNQASGVAV